MSGFSILHDRTKRVIARVSVADDCPEEVSRGLRDWISEAWVVLDDPAPDPSALDPEADSPFDCARVPEGERLP